MTTNDRSSIRLRLLGADYPNGEIPLSHLARIAEGAQLVATRLARSQAGQSGPGRTQRPLADGVRLMLISIEPGSTQLLIAGPAHDPQLELGPGYEELVDRTLAQITNGLDASATGGELPAEFDDLARRGMVEWLQALGDAAPEVEIESTVGGRVPRLLRFRPAEARTHLTSQPAADELPRPPVEIEGVLYSVNLHTGHYRIEDDIGSSIDLTSDELDSDTIGALLGKRVRVVGVASRDEKGRIKDVKATSMAPASDVIGLDPGQYWSDEAERGRILDAEPLDSISELSIEGVTDDEIDEFLKAIRE